MTATYAQAVRWGSVDPELTSFAAIARGQVGRQRTLFWVEQLDEVRDLRDFLELEGVLAEGEDVSARIAAPHR